MIVDAYIVNATKLNLRTGNSGSGLKCYIANNKNFVVCGEDECLDYYPVYHIKNGIFSIFDDLISNIRAATKQEILDVGLWDFVINKNDSLTLSDELDEYLCIGQKKRKG